MHTCRLLCREPSTPLTASDHHKALNYMCKVRDEIEKGNDLNRECKLYILSAGIACTKRMYCGGESVDEMMNLSNTIALLFVLLVMVEPAEHMQSYDCQQMGSEMTDVMRVEREDEKLIRSWEMKALSEHLFTDTNHFASSFSACLRSSEQIAKAALREALHLRSEDVCLQSFKPLAWVFFKSSAEATAESLLLACGATHYQYVELADVRSIENKSRLDTIVQSAESESGQQVLRDLILSFKLPNKVVGIRRTLALSREVNRVATLNYTETLNTAHEAAMRGASWSWNHDDDEIHKASALLAGTAMILTKDCEMKRTDAFDGRVSLPFLQCCSTKNGSTLTYVQSTSEWVVYSIQEGKGARVKAKLKGLDGLCKCLLILIDSTSTTKR